MAQVAPNRRRATRVTFEIDAPVHTIGSLLLPFEEEPPEPVVIHAIMENEVSRKVVEEHKKSLRDIVSKQRNSLQQSLGCRISHGSLRSILSEKLEKSSTSLLGKQLDHDSTEATEDMTDFSMSDRNLFFDFDEQQRTLDFTNADSDDDGDSFECPQPVESAPTAGKIEVTPGIFVPLRGAPETWQAIKYGCTTTTMCQECQMDLHCVEDAEHIVCPDCWMVSPVEQSIGGIALEFDGSSRNHGLGLGVKASQVLQWIEAEDR